MGCMTTATFTRLTARRSDGIPGSWGLFQFRQEVIGGLTFSEAADGARRSAAPGFNLDALLDDLAGWSEADAEAEAEAELAAARWAENRHARWDDANDDPYWG